MALAGARDSRDGRRREHPGTRGVERARLELKPGEASPAPARPPAHRSVRGSGCLASAALPALAGDQPAMGRAVGPVMRDHGVRAGSPRPAGRRAPGVRPFLRTRRRGHADPRRRPAVGRRRDALRRDREGHNRRPPPSAVRAPVAPSRRCPGSSALRSAPSADRGPVELAATVSDAGRQTRRVADRQPPSGGLVPFGPAVLRWGTPGQARCRSDQCRSTTPLP